MDNYVSVFGQELQKKKESQRGSDDAVARVLALAVDPESLPEENEAIIRMMLGTNIEEQQASDVPATDSNINRHRRPTGGVEMLGMVRRSGQE